MSSFDYASAYGYHSLAAAIVFAVVYVPLAGWFIFKCISQYTSVWLAITLFCIIRVTAFVIRAIEIGITSAGTNESLLIADQIFLLAGFFGLLLASYTLILDRELFVETADAKPSVYLKYRRPAFRMTGMVAIVLGIVAVADTDLAQNTVMSLKKASASIFLVLTVVQAVQTVILIVDERSRSERFAPPSREIGVAHGAIIFGALSVLMLAREAFSIATVTKLSTQLNEHFWYPLIALPEVLCVLLLCVPGLVPPRRELPKM